MPDFPDATILSVDLSERSIRVETLPGSIYRLYPGGSSLAAYLVLKNLRPGVDALSPENVLVFAVSPLTGLPIAGLSRVTAAAKSPLSGGMGDSQAGGFLPSEMKANGYDAVVFKGKASDPVYLHIKDGCAELKSAGRLRGKTTGEAEDALRSELGEAIEIAQIGPAGENRVRFACIVHNCSRANGRTGIGAVMGSKNLRALVVSHAEKPKPRDPEAFGKICGRLVEKLRDPFWRHFKERGTTINVEILRGMGYLPTQNYASGWFPAFKGFQNEELKGGGGCYACPLDCKRVAGKSEAVEPRYGGPEYETIAALGSYCGVSQTEAINISNQICNMYGMDTVSCGATISFAIECAEKGLLDEYARGLSLSFGDAETIHRLMTMIAKREGIGDLLAEGSKRAAEIIGNGAEKYALTSKGQELPAHMPQLKPALGLIYAVNPGGADHQSSEHDSVLFASGGSSVRRWLSLLGVDRDYSGKIDAGSAKLDEFKVRFALLTQYFYSLLDTLSMCQFVWGPSWQALGPEDILDAVLAGIGWSASVPELLEIGERRLNMTRYFNAREGFSKKDDTLPERLFDPLPDGPAKGARVDRESFEEAKELYYSLAGWDAASGNPTREKLESLSLGWLLRPDSSASSSAKFADFKKFRSLTSPTGSTKPSEMSASILAGGKSSRMGTDKALLEWREKNFLETILQTLSIFKNVMISTAGKDQYGWARCAKAPDLFPGVGPIGGIYSSLASSPDEYLFITACDTPFLSADLIKSICEAASGYQCFVAKERDGRLHPLCGVYHKSAISVLKERIERGRYKIAPAYDLLKTGYFDLSPSQAAELKNFNTKEEYLRMIESL